ncbi:MAG TPA: hypothetical protein VFA80_03595 [Xanthobacteraceae bacterium]|nr:hypothetical protein [Xanthobacteraceae bacterium]
MDERRTLSILAWSVGCVVGTMFILNAVALSFVASSPTPASKQVAARSAPAPHAPVIPVARGG